jgi:putative flavoprotein involved in K+ transport
MRRTEAVVIGGGQAGLATSRCLKDRGIDHVVVERGRVAERWRSERWDSLRLLTPNWQSRLPGFRYQGEDSDGYMSMLEVAGYLERYARSFDAPVEERTTVVSVETCPGGYRVVTDRGEWQAPSVVVATGHCDVPHVPPIAQALPQDVRQLTPSAYRDPAQLGPGGVLVVGAAASGVQLADEIHASGRAVTLSVGRHTRLPRLYRGRDILWWLDAAGVFDETIDDVYDLGVSRDQPSLQLVGRPDHATLDLRVLQERGVRLAGRLAAIDGSRAIFADDLVVHTVSADVRLARLLQRIDAFAESHGLATDVPPPVPFAPFPWPADGRQSLDFRAEGIETVLWATGFRRLYPWLHVPVLDGRGEIRHEGGVTPAPGLCVMGLYFQRRRKSSFIDGVGEDAAEISDHLARWLRAAA